MANAIDELTEHANKVVDAVQERDGLASRTAAMERIIEEYEEVVLDPVLRPKYVEPGKKKRKGNRGRSNSVYELFG